MFPVGEDKLYAEDGTVCYHEHCKQMLKVDKNFTFCSCPAVEDENFSSIRRVVCAQATSMD